MDLRSGALAALLLPDPDAKARATAALWAAADESPVAEVCEGPDERPGAGPEGALLPGRPVRPPLVAPKDVPHRSPFTREGLAGLLHAICHIEFNAINLALDAVWRFGGMPRAFYLDWLRVAAEEAYHFGLLRNHLARLGHAYGDFPAHDGLWTMCMKTSHDIVARMALVPRTLEARGLDASPQIQARLRKVATPEALAAVDILEIILRDEVGHVAIGNHWYRVLCEARGLDPVALYPELVKRYEAPRLKPPFNDTARRKAGFTQAEIDWLGR